MNLKILALLIVCIATGILWSHKKQTPVVDFFDIKFLQTPDAVIKELENYGFCKINFTTKDNLCLQGIMLDQSHDKKVTTTILSCAGFYPGRKEGMSTLYAMLKNNPYNFLFFDARGHGNSQGEMFTYYGIMNYGQYEYLDIIAALQWIVAYNKEHDITNNIIIHGLCSGAFHASKAVIELKKTDPEIYECIKGIVFDSGWSSVAQITETTLVSEAKKKCKIYNILFLEPYISYCLTSFYKFFFKLAHQQQESLLVNINKIEQPILFIHAENDTFVPIEHVHPITEKALKPKRWFIKESTHAVNHLKHKDEYQIQLHNFIESVLSTCTHLK